MGFNADINESDESNILCKMSSFVDLLLHFLARNSLLRRICLFLASAASSERVPIVFLIMWALCMRILCMDAGK